MKKKYFTIIFLVVGLILICLSIILAIVATVNKVISGGPDFPTILLVFSRGKGGLYSILASCGIISLVISAVLGLRKRND
jgi:hypothetical protein